MTPFETAWVLAFAMGLLSAVSLPLGTLTTALWTPGDRVVAVLMAFGGGALLAALTIDLVGSALDKGHFFSLAAGCLLGGLLFRLLNEAINSKGGFLRKSSTLIQYLERRRRERFRRALANLRRAEVLAALPDDAVAALAENVFGIEVVKGTTLYQPHDPAERLYVVESGAIELRDPGPDQAPVQTLGSGDAFGHMGFLTGSPRAMFAIAASDSRLWVLPKAAFRSTLAATPELARGLAAFLQSEQTAAYLRDYHDMVEADIANWRDDAVRCLVHGEPVADAVRVERKEHAFLELADRIGRFPLFDGLPETERRAVAERLICNRHGRGETLFHKDEPAERLYIVETGEVSLIDPADPTRRPTKISDHEAFGGFSFLTGAHHSVGAMVTDETVLWALRRRDFDELLSRSPALAERVRDVLEQDDVARYLQARQSFDTHRAARWTRTAVRNLDTGRLIPSASEMAREMKEHSGAPVAIWLGILLDGIPEALVIGASLLHGGQVSYSLIAGLFLSNYPEALSSSVGMRQQGMSFGRVLFMWTSLTVLTGFFAAVGNLALVGAPPTVFSIVEGIAAGAMLTMIAETMMPEAYLKGGSVVGLSTLAGFLVAIFFTTLE